MGLAAAGGTAPPRPDQQRREGGDVEGEQLDHQGRADVGAQHDRQRCGERDETAGRERGEHQRGGGGALQGERDRRAGARRLEAVGERACQEGAKPRAERPLHAGLHHVHAPEQQGGEAGQVEDDEAKGDGRRPPGAVTRGRRRGTRMVSDRMIARRDCAPAALARRRAASARSKARGWGTHGRSDRARRMHG